MTFPRTIIISFALAAGLTGLGACSRTDVAKQSGQQEPVRTDTAASMSPAPGDAQAQQVIVPKGMENNTGAIDDNAAHPVDPSPMQSTPSSAALPPSSALPPTGSQTGAPASDSPAPASSFPQASQPQNTGSRPPSEMPIGTSGMGSTGNGIDTRKAAVQTTLSSKSGFENVVVDIGHDGCVSLTGKVQSAEKKEEAAALARGASGGSCVTNGIVVKK